MPVARPAAKPVENPERKVSGRSLAAIVNEINKTAPGSVVRGSDVRVIERRTSGSFALDAILGGGWPVNKWAELYGEYSSGKTTVVLKTIAANQILDPEWTCWWLAAEDFDYTLAAMCGVDCSRVLLHETNVMQEGFQKIIEVAGTREVDCIVIDSYPALVPAEEDVNDVGSWSTGLAPRINNQFWRKQAPATRRSLITPERPMLGFVINQPREKIGVMFGSNETTPGGRGKNFAYYTRLWLRRGEWLEIGPKNSRERVGQVIQATTVKAKSSRPQRTAGWNFYFENVVDQETGELLHPAGSYDVLSEIVNVSLAYGAVRAGGGGMYYYGERAFKGRPALYEALKADEAMSTALTSEVMRLVNPSVAPAPDPVATPAKAPSAVKRLKAKT